jgi:TP901 family phage tail tape measure protein
MRKFGLAAILTFVDKGATAAMGRVGRIAGKLKKQFRGIGQGVAQFGRGLGTLATAALPLTGALGLVIRKGAQFEQSIARLRSKMLKEFDPALKGLAKTLGATTAFSATQAADAMTALATAGFTAKEIQGAIKPVLNAAAAEGITLAEAADIVAIAMRGMGVSAEEAGKAAGIMALASTKANTTMLELKEGLKLAAPGAKEIGAKLSDVVAVLGATADIGVKATSAGTAFRAALARLKKPTKDVRKGLAQAGVSMKQVRDFIDKGDVIGLFQKISKGLGGIDKNSKRASASASIFGIRGAAIGSALGGSKKKVDKFNKTLAALRAETGKTAEQMKKIQLDTLIGQGKLVTSALEGISLELFKLIGTETKNLASGLVKTLSDLALAMRVVGGEKITDPETKKQLKGVSSTIMEVARGIKEGIGEAKVALRGVFKTLAGVGAKFGLAFGGKGGAKNIAKMVTKLAAMAAVLAPVALGFLAVTKVAGGMKDVIVGGMRVAIGAGKAAGTVLGGVGSILSKRIPVLGKIFGGIGGVVGRAARAAEKATAMPVRVVNFDEAPGGGILGAAAGAGGLPGVTAAGAQTVGMFARLRLAMNGFAGKIPLIGTALSSNVSALAGASGSLVGKLGKFGLAIGAAGAAGWAFGSWLDKKFGLSDKISSFFADRDKKFRDKILGPLRKQENSLKQSVTSARTLNQLISLRKRGITSVGIGGGKRAEITREFAQRRLIETLKLGKASQKEIATQLARLAPILAKLPVASQKPAQVTKPKPAKDALVSSTGLLQVSPGDVLLDRASLAGAVVSQLRGGLLGRAGGGALGGGAPAQTSPAPAASSEPIRIEVPVAIDGKQVALAVAEVRLDDLERSGASLKPGQRSALLQRGFTEET